MSKRREWPTENAGRAFADVWPAAQVCRHCGEVGGKMQSVTYRGAPDGGIPVHAKCVQLFFAAMDKAPHRY